jgi:hypothetical protein
LQFHSQVVSARSRIYAPTLSEKCYFCITDKCGVLLYTRGNVRPEKSYGTTGCSPTLINMRAFPIKTYYHKKEDNEQNKKEFYNLLFLVDRQTLQIVFISKYSKETHLFIAFHRYKCAKKTLSIET